MYTSNKQKRIIKSGYLLGLLFSRLKSISLIVSQSTWSITSIRNNSPLGRLLLRPLPGLKNLGFSPNNFRNSLVCFSCRTNSTFFSVAPGCVGNRIRRTLEKPPTLRNSGRFLFSGLLKRGRREDEDHSMERRLLGTEIRFGSSIFSLC